MSSDIITSPLNIPTRRNRSASISGNFGWPISSAAIYGTSPLSPPSSFNRRFSGSWAPTFIGSPPGQSSMFQDSASTMTNTVDNTTTTASSSPTDISATSHIPRAKTLPIVTFTFPLSSSIPAYSNFARSKSTSSTPLVTRASDNGDDEDDLHPHHHYHNNNNNKGRFDTVKNEATALDRPTSPMRNAILTGQFLD